jgi:hypothetical protein
MLDFDVIIIQMSDEIFNATRFSFMIIDVQFWRFSFTHIEMRNKRKFMCQ